MIQSQTIKNTQVSIQIIPSFKCFKCFFMFYSIDFIVFLFAFMSSELVQSPTNSPSPSVENTTNTNVTSNVVESNEPKPKLTLNGLFDFESFLQISNSQTVFQTIKTAQYEHGLRHGSFQRYREYCERKIRRVRVTSKQTHSKRFQKQKQLNFENVLSLEILLFQAERAWSMAMELKEYVASNARSKFHLRRRMDKAAKWSCLLLEATRSYADARTALEAEVCLFSFVFV